MGVKLDLTIKGSRAVKSVGGLSGNGRRMEKTAYSGAL
jgi:hypothetical protein